MKRYSEPVKKESADAAASQVIKQFLQSLFNYNMDSVAGDFSNLATLLANQTLLPQDYQKPGTDVILQQVGSSDHSDVSSDQQPALKSSEEGSSTPTDEDETGDEEVAKRASYADLKKQLRRSSRHHPKPEASVALDDDSSEGKESKSSLSRRGSWRLSMNSKKGNATDTDDLRAFVAVQNASKLSTPEPVRSRGSFSLPASPMISRRRASSVSVVDVDSSFDESEIFRNQENALSANRILSRLDRSQLHTLISAMILLAPKNDSLENYTPIPFGMEENQKFRLIRTGNKGLVLVKPFEKEKLQLSCGLFVLDENREPLDPATRQLWLSLTEEMVLQCITNLESVGNVFRAGAGHYLYFTFIRMQRAIRENPEITLQQLQHYRVALCLEQVFEERSELARYAALLGLSLGSPTSASVGSKAAARGSFRGSIKGSPKFEKLYGAESFKRAFETVQADASRIDEIRKRIQQGNAEDFNHLINLESKQLVINNLDLSQCVPDSPFMLAVNSCLLGNFEPQELSLASWKGSEEDLQAFLKRNGAELIRLDLSGSTGVTDKIFTTLAKHCKKLEWLSVAQTSVSVIRSDMPMLQHLDLSHCFFVNDGIFEYLSQRCPNLRSLVLRQTSITQIGHPLSVTHLDISECPGVDDDIYPQLKAQCPSLKYLTMREVQVTNLNVDGLELIAVDVSGSNNLTQITASKRLLNKRKLSDKPSVRMVRASHCDKLRDISLRDAADLISLHASHNKVLESISLASGKALPRLITLAVDQNPVLMRLLVCPLKLKRVLCLGTTNISHMLDDQVLQALLSHVVATKVDKSAEASQRSAAADELLVRLLGDKYRLFATKRFGNDVFSDTCRAGADLSGADLHETDNTGADLSRVTAYGINLNNTVLIRSNLTGLNLGQLPMLIEHTNPVKCVTTHADSRITATCDLNGHVIVRDAARVLREISYDKSVNTLSISPNGRFLAVAGGFTRDASHATTRMLRAILNSIGQEYQEKQCNDLVGELLSSYDIPYEKIMELRSEVQAAVKSLPKEPADKARVKRNETLFDCCDRIVSVVKDKEAVDDLEQYLLKLDSMLRQVEELHREYRHKCKKEFLDTVFKLQREFEMAEEPEKNEELSLKIAQLYAEYCQGDLSDLSLKLTSLKSVATRIEKELRASTLGDYSAVSCNITVNIWDLHHMDELDQSYRLHSDTITTTCWSPCGTKLAAGSEDGRFKVVSMKGGEILEFSGIQGGITSIAWHKSGNLLAVSSYSGKIQIWDLERAECIKELTRHQGREVLKAHESIATCVAFTPDGERLLSCGSYRAVRVWRTQDWSLEKELSSDQKDKKNERIPGRGHNKTVEHIAVFPNSQYVVTCDDMPTLGGFTRDALNKVIVWNIETGVKCREIALNCGVSSVSVVPGKIGSGHWVILMACNDNKIRRCTVSEADLRRNKDCPDARVLTAIEADITASKASSETAQLLHQLGATGDPVPALSLSTSPRPLGRRKSIDEYVSPRGEPPQRPSRGPSGQRGGADAVAWEGAGLK